LKSLAAYIGAENPSFPYVAPFGALVALMALGPYVPLRASIYYPMRVILVSAVLLACSRSLIRLDASRWGASVLVGVAVFVVWIGPDLLWPGYRSHFLLQNKLTGAVASSIPARDRLSAAFLMWRGAGSAVLVPIVEELFWRAWLMRYLISRHFENVPLGAYATPAFWITAVLFASEHGPYWDVGLAAGVVYNWWMLRTRRVADCIVAHAATNACLTAYVVHAGQWQYWL
jgi:CAAX prenyl protease-like protein